MNIEIDNKSIVEYEIARNKDGDTIVSTDYSKLTNKPKINDVELTDNKTLEELGIQPKGNYVTEEYVNSLIGDIESLLSEV